jgi:hypothetical protein
MDTPDIWYSADEQCTVIDVDALLEWLKQERDRWPDSPHYNTLDWLIRALRAKSRAR